MCCAGVKALSRLLAQLQNQRSFNQPCQALEVLHAKTAGLKELYALYDNAALVSARPAIIDMRFAHNYVHMFWRCERPFPQFIIDSIWLDEISDKMGAYKYLNKSASEIGDVEIVSQLTLETLLLSSGSWC